LPDEVPQSLRYRTLCHNLSRIRRNHLGFSPRLNGDYTNRELSEGAAYTVFAHGEFEAFLEDWATDILNRIVSRGFGTAASPRMAHLAGCASSFAVPGGIPGGDGWPTFFGQAAAAHRNAIRGNHGIAERHICRLLIPLGFDVTLIDSILISDLSSFASIRGDHAHLSVRSHLGQRFDPFDRMAKAEAIKILLGTLDLQLKTHLASC
jgi:hypothetical protein